MTNPTGKGNGGGMNKFFLKSRTFQGLIITFIGMVLQVFGVETERVVVETAWQELLQIYPTIIEVVGLIYAGFGRVKSSGKIQFKKTLLN